MSWPRPWYEVGEVIAASLLCMLMLLRVWVAVDRYSQAAASVRLAFNRRGAGNVLWAVVGLSALFIAAEGILDRGHDELLHGVDPVVRHTSHRLATLPAVHQTARRLSDVTGLGLVTAMLSVVVSLLVLRHRREALILLVGSLSAWPLSGVLKLGFGVQRPHSSSMGFPSGHVLATVVGCGLVAWSLGRFADSRVRQLLYVGAGAIAVSSALARVILDAHWFTDVVGGLAAGTAWLNVVILTAWPFVPREGSQGIDLHLG